MSSQPKFFACRSSAFLADKIAKSFGSELGKLHVLEFSDGEIQPYFEESVRGCDVFIIQSTFPPSDNLMELLLAIDAARRASARNIIAVIPYFGFARQDRKDRPRVSIGSKLVANLLTAAGVTRIMTMDLHADQIQGFFDVPVDHLYASAIFAPYIRSLGLDNMVVAAPDIGGSKRANSYSKFLGLEMAMVYKQRAKANQVQAMTMIGDVQDKHVIMIDDMVDTAGTLTKAADLMIDNGALTVRAFCTHPILSGNAYERIMQSKLTEMVVTDTIPLKQSCDKIHVLSVADLFSDVIKKLLEDESISSTFIF
ncbi:MAG: ribose-phosphate pyrophosphokinase [Candidatus Competibacteraceae bacterium]|nr:ribose-phosphate pyrophosphokinase [Candidatus Competibacteraceae bacterium]